VQRLVIPRDIIWLNGPPGSGKGANLGFVKRIRGLSRAITMSAMLERNPEAVQIIRGGGLVPDEVVGDALLQQACDPAVADRAGIIIDGFPRSENQARPPVMLAACIRAGRAGVFIRSLPRSEIQARPPLPACFARADRARIIVDGFPRSQRQVRHPSMACAWRRCAAV
jgi:Adenylate kinase